MTKLEEIARAICLVRLKCEGRIALRADGTPMQWQEYVDIAWPLYAADARAALEAARSLSDAMKELAVDQTNDLDRWPVWETLIDAILEEGQ